MRYLITLLVVLSFVASFGSYELESARLAGADQFGITAGGILASRLTTHDFAIGPHFGVEYGLSEYLSVVFKGDYLCVGSYYDSFSRGSLCLSLKGGYDFDGSPFSIGLSLGSEFYDQVIRKGKYNDNDEYFIGKNCRTRFIGRGNLTLQAGFIYWGLTLNLDDKDSDLHLRPSFMVLGFDVEFSENLSMLIELGGIYPCLSLGMELIL